MDFAPMIMEWYLSLLIQVAQERELKMTTLQNEIVRLRSILRQRDR